MCVDAVAILYRRGATSDNGVKATDEHGAASNTVYTRLLEKYQLADIDEVLEWLVRAGFIGYFGFGPAPRMGMKLTAKGVRLAETGQLDEADRKLVYRENPYAAFVARQFRGEDNDLFAALKRIALTPIGIEAIDGRVDGVEAFRGEILRKIRFARFFICLLTRRDLLAGRWLKSREYASSVWLYQETGAAVALGKKPIVLVETGISKHFAGELQDNYESVTFSRTNYDDAFHEVGRRLSSDLTANHIPLPTS
jgi:hypothetical protein